MNTNTTTEHASDHLDHAASLLQHACSSRRSRRHPDPCARVVGAFPRLIDLQLQGFAYIKFE